MPLLLQLQKRPVIKIPVDIAKEMKSSSRGSGQTSHKIGERESIKWFV